MSDELISGLSEDDVLYIIRSLLDSRIGAIISLIGVAIICFAKYVLSLNVLSLFDLVDRVFAFVQNGVFLFEVSLNITLEGFIILLVGIILYIYGFVGRLLKGVYIIYEYTTYFPTSLVFTHLAYIIYGLSYAALLFIAYSPRIGIDLSMFTTPMYYAGLLLLVASHVLAGSLLVGFGSIINSGLVKGAGYLFYIAILYPYIEIIALIMIYFALTFKAYALHRVKYF